jgi:hypothetical protein
MKKRASLILGIVQLFVAIGAIPAGLFMIMEPHGTALGMTTEILKNSPFHNFLIPGIFLFTVNGVFNLIAAILSFCKFRFAGLTGLGLGIALIIWILVQVFSIGLNHFLQPAYFFIGIIEILISVVLIKREKSL